MPIIFFYTFCKIVGIMKWDDDEREKRAVDAEGDSMGEQEKLPGHYDDVAEDG
jgi:hypothetical protein